MPTFSSLTTTDIPRLRRLFQEYMEIHLIGNQHLIDILFHSFLGVVCGVKSYYGGQTLIPRTHAFPIQNSGTGKSQAGEALFWLLWFIIGRNNVFKCFKTSDAALVGSPDQKKKLEEGQSRLLFKKEFLYWDEGSMLLKDAPFSEDLRDILQMAMDESRWIQKALKDGMVQGYTNTTIVAGSYLENKIKQSVLKTGFFQRFIVTFKKYTEKEKIEIAEGLERLEDPTLHTRKQKLMREIKEELIKNYDFKYPVNVDERKVIRFSQTASREFTKVFLDYYKANILNQYMDDRQDVIESVWSRVRLHVVKFAIENAYLHHRDELTIEDYLYAFDLVEKYHIQGMKNLLDSISDKKNSLRTITRSTQKDFLLQCINELTKRNAGKPVTQTTILDYIGELKTMADTAGEKPNFGKNRAGEWLKEMEKDGIIKVEHGENNRSLISVNIRK